MICTGSGLVSGSCVTRHRSGTVAAFLRSGGSSCGRGRGDENESAACAPAQRGRLWRRLKGAFSGRAPIRCSWRGAGRGWRDRGVSRKPHSRRKNVFHNKTAQTQRRPAAMLKTLLLSWHRSTSAHNMNTPWMLLINTAPVFVSGCVRLFLSVTVVASAVLNTSNHCL